MIQKKEDDGRQRGDEHKFLNAVVDVAKRDEGGGHVEQWNFSPGGAAKQNGQPRLYHSTKAVSAVGIGSRISPTLFTHALTGMPDHLVPSVTRTSPEEDEGGRWRQSAPAPSQGVEYAFRTRERSEEESGEHDRKESHGSMLGAYGGITLPQSEDKWKLWEVDGPGKSQRGVGIPGYKGVRPVLQRREEDRPLETDVDREIERERLQNDEKGPRAKAKEEENLRRMFDDRSSRAQVLAMLV